MLSLPTNKPRIPQISHLSPLPTSHEVLHVGEVLGGRSAVLLAFDLEDIGILCETHIFSISSAHLLPLLWSELLRQLQLHPLKAVGIRLVNRQVLRACRRRLLHLLRHPRIVRGGLLHCSHEIITREVCGLDILAEVVSDVGEIRFNCFYSTF